MKKLLLILFSIAIISGRLPAGDEFCLIRNASFQAGEQISYVVFYNALGLFVNAGDATFKTSLTMMNNKPVYHIVGEGVTNSSYDWIYKVRDRYESYFDTATLQPYKFIRSVQEGGYKKYEEVVFNHANHTALTNDGVFKLPGCIQDVVSSMYYARNIQFDKYKVGDKIPFAMFIDNEVSNLYIRYVGKEVIKTRYGKFRAIKIKPLLVKGTIFDGGEKMTVWLSDDGNKIPLRVESPIVVGSVKVDMMGYKNLRHPLTSLISFR